jgi:hypothetical protein
MLDFRYIVSVVTGGLFIIFSIAAPSEAAKSCKWMFGPIPELEPPHNVTIDQGNQFQITRNILFNATKTPQHFDGTCQSNKDTHGSISGGNSSLNQSAFHMEVTWDGGSVVDGQLVDGRTFDKAHPKNWSTFTLRVGFPCSTHS